MSRSDRQRLSIFFILIGVFVLTLVLGYRMNGPATTAAVQSPETKPTTSAPAASDARIRLDIVENPDNAGDIGQKNLFQYGQRRDLSLLVAGFRYREIAAMTGGRTFTNVNKQLVRARAAIRRASTS